MRLKGRDHGLCAASRSARATNADLLFSSTVWSPNWLHGDSRLRSSHVLRRVLQGFHDYLRERAYVTCRAPVVFEKPNHVQLVTTVVTTVRKGRPEAINQRVLLVSYCPSPGYCPAGATLPHPCPDGEYLPAIGSAQASACVSCPAGFYCKYQPDTLAVLKKCPAGYYCEAGSTTPDQHVAPPGSFAGVGSGRSSLCPVGTYSEAEGQERCKPCPPGSVCHPYAFWGEAQALGHYPTVSFVLLVADVVNSRWTKSATLDTTAPALTSIHEAFLGNPPPTATRLNPLQRILMRRKCEKIHGCTGVQLFRANSTFAVRGGSARDHCTPCTPGYYCSGTGLTEPTGACSRGYYCGADGRQQSCPQGFYCPEGTQFPQQYPCPPGTYLDYEGARDESECTACPEGRVCDDPGNTSADDLCPPGTTRVSCRRRFTTVLFTHIRGERAAARKYTGVRCTGLSLYHKLETHETSPEAESKRCCRYVYCQAVSSGRRLPGVNIDHPLLHSSGDAFCHYCVEGTDVLFGDNKCKIGEYCPEGSTEPSACPLGYYCNTEGLKWPSGRCYAGFLCNSRTVTPSPLEGATGSACPENMDGEICPPGNFCLPSSVIATVVGTGAAGDSGDGTAAEEAELNQPTHAVQNSGLHTDIFFVDKANNKVKRVDGSTAQNKIVVYDVQTETITELTSGVTGPVGMYVDFSNTFLYVASGDSHRVYKVNIGTKAVEPWLGSGTAGSAVGNGLLDTELNGPRDVLLDEEGSVFVADTGNSRSEGLLYDMLVADTANNRIRRLSLSAEIRGRELAAEACPPELISVTTGKAARTTVTSDFVGSNRPGNAVDGNENRGWLSSEIREGESHGLEIDLRDYYFISQFEVRSGQADGQHAMTSFLLMAWSDAASDWIMATSPVNDLTATTYSGAIVQLYTKKVKLVVTQRQVYIAEFVVMGTDAPASDSEWASCRSELRFSPNGVSVDRILGVLTLSAPPKFSLLYGVVILLCGLDGSAVLAWQFQRIRSRHMHAVHGRVLLPKSSDRRSVTSSISETPTLKNISNCVRLVAGHFVLPTASVAVWLLSCPLDDGLVLKNAPLCSEQRDTYEDEVFCTGLCYGGVVQTMRAWILLRRHRPHCPQWPMRCRYGGIPCPVGYYCPGGCQAPQKCPPGTVIVSTGARFASECKQCPAGVYQASIQACICSRGYMHFENGVDLSDQDGDTDCIERVVLAQVCNTSCRRRMNKLKLNTVNLVFLDSENVEQGTASLSKLSGTSLIMAGEPSCADTAGCPVIVVNSTEAGLKGLYGPPDDMQTNIQERLSASMLTRNSFSFDSSRVPVDALNPRNALAASVAYDAEIEDYINPGILNPVRCITQGTAIAFIVHPGSQDTPPLYPVYLKESFFNTESTFDFGQLS
ncbi:UNVERIFIED_CONTAM: hypothetical protein H355_013666 [Colinus virginianus]|nr:hypothetical protein H355_013666 [Colinus virginianus]